MNRIKTQLIISTMLCGGLIGLLTPDSAHADVVTAFYTSSSSYGYEIFDMPDLDQRRMTRSGSFGLPGNGSMYCVPTSTMNMIMYAANHGFSTVDPGPNLWQLQSQYNLAGLKLLNMGTFMGTTTTGGTGGSGWKAGAKQWLDPYGFFTINNYYASGSYSPRTHGMTQTAVSGALVSFCYGRYDVVGSISGRPLVIRDGGHCITLSKTNSGFGQNKIWVRDPADEPDKNSDPANYLFTQSTFGNRKFDALDVNMQYGGLLNQWRTMTTLNYTPGADRVALLDGYIAIAPKSGYSFTNSGHNFNFHFPNSMQGSGQGSSESFELAGTSSIMDMVIHPDLYWQVVLTTDPAGGIPALGKARTNHETIRAAPVMDAKKIFIGRNRRLYLLSDTQLFCIDIDDPAWPVESSVVLPGVADALTYDDATDEVIVLSIAESSILSYPSTLPAGVAPTVLSIPGTVLMAGQASIACSPMEPGVFWIATEGSNSIYGIQQSPLAIGVTVEEVSVPSITDPTSVDFDDVGNMFVVSNGAVVQLTPNPLEDGWDEVPEAEAPFGRIAVGPMFRVTRSRTNFVDTEHAGPAWRNLDPETEELVTGDFELDCIGDANGDRLVNVTDLLNLLGAWGDCEICNADSDANRLINVTDLLALLGAWGVCP